MKSFFVVRIGRFHFGIPAEYVRRALPVIPHLEAPLLKPNFGGLVLYNKRFIAKLFLDNVLQIGLYRQADSITMDSTVIFEVSGVTFCSTVDEVLPVTPVEEHQILPIDAALVTREPIFPKPEYLLGYFEHRQKHVYILNMPHIFQRSFTVSPN
ncbi:MAG: hypothetical protein CMR00_10450 [[Chlorobium] sp. 445]|nr:MAG: hypothetical protein CMR00_10450 [[Chlorobium] sp. 445]